MANLIHAMLKKTKSGLLPILSDFFATRIRGVGNASVCALVGGVRKGVPIPRRHGVLHPRCRTKLSAPQCCHVCKWASASCGSSASSRGIPDPGVGQERAKGVLREARGALDPAIATSCASKFRQRP
jgi:hypothetical protein